MNGKINKSTDLTLILQIVIQNEPRTMSQESDYELRLTIYEDDVRLVCEHLRPGWCPHQTEYCQQSYY